MEHLCREDITGFKNHVNLSNSPDDHWPIRSNVQSPSASTTQHLSVEGEVSRHCLQFHVLTLHHSLSQTLPALQLLLHLHLRLYEQA